MLPDTSQNGSEFCSSRNQLRLPHLAQVLRPTRTAAQSRGRLADRQTVCKRSQTWADRARVVTCSMHACMHAPAANRPSGLVQTGTSECNGSTEPPALQPRRCPPRHAVAVKQASSTVGSWDRSLVTCLPQTGHSLRMAQAQLVAVLTNIRPQVAAAGILHDGKITP